MLYEDEKWLFTLLHVVVVIFHLKLTQIIQMYLYLQQLHPLLTTKRTSPILPCQGLELNLSGAAERQNADEQYGGTKNASRHSLHATRAGKTRKVLLFTRLSFWVCMIKQTKAGAELWRRRAKQNPRCLLRSGGNGFLLCPPNVSRSPVCPCSLCRCVPHL